MWGTCNDTSKLLASMVSSGAVDHVAMLIDFGVDVNAPTFTEWGDTLLHATCDSVKLFLEARPPYVAEQRRAAAVALLLIRAGADVNALNPRGQTPLDYAEISGFHQVAEVLGRHGAKTSEELKAEAAGSGKR